MSPTVPAAASPGPGRPPPAPEERARWFFRVRVAVLLGLLALSIALALHDSWSRARRNRWDRPLLVGFVFVSGGALDPATLSELRRRAVALEDHLAAEFGRVRAAGGAEAGAGALPLAGKPIGIVIHQADHAAPPPAAPADDGAIAALSAFWQRRRWLAEVDALAGVDRRGHDATVYVVARPPAGERVRTVEGQSEQGGRVGLVSVELDDTMVDLALIVATHELFHTLGATDKYDATGRALVPDGLAEPERIPLFPQRFVEVMARNVPLGPDEEAPPESLDQLRVGGATARELGWLGAEAR